MEPRIVCLSRSWKTGSCGAIRRGRIPSDGGGLLLREAERGAGIIRQFAASFRDHRHPGLIEPTVEERIAQRIYGLALGYEDLNDHDELRHDPLLAVLVGKKDPLGRDRMRPQDKGKALAGKSTLNRLEPTPVRANARIHPARGATAKTALPVRDSR